MVTFLWKVYGFDRQRRSLQKVLLSGRLSHAYIFSGPQNIGKTALAVDFAKVLLCQDKDLLPCGRCAGCRPKLSINPDFFISDRPGEIKIETIRNLKEKFSFKAAKNQRQVAILANAQNLTNEAANALLKLFEEPAAHTVIILTTNSPRALPETLVSRAQSIFFGSPGAAALSEFMKNKNINPKKSDLLTRYCGKSLGKIADCLNSEETFDLLCKQMRDLQELASQNLGQKLMYGSDLAALENEEVVSTLQSWLLFLDTDLLSNSSPSEFFVKAKRIEAVNSALTSLNFNANRKLVFDNLMCAF